MKYGILKARNSNYHFEGWTDGNCCQIILFFDEGDSVVKVIRKGLQDPVFKGITGNYADVDVRGDNVYFGTILEDIDEYDTVLIR